MAYNIMTCGGWEGVTGWIASGDCMKARISIVILFFVLAIIRKWGFEEWGGEFAFWASLVIGIPLYLILITITGNFKIALVVGLIAGIAAGYFGGVMFGGSE